MNFAFSDDQTLLKNSARALLDEHCKPEHVRAMQEDARGYGEALWGEMAKLGWLGMGFPEKYGGSPNPFPLAQFILNAELDRSGAPARARARQGAGRVRRARPGVQHDGLAARGANG